MGYRSDVVIAIRKSILAKDLIAPSIPSVIKELSTASTDAATYYFIEGWKWYPSYPEVQEIEAWFDSMNDEEFGAMRIGEDDNDTQTWGSPYEFEVYLSRQISAPVTNPD
jgi:hypothetical protein